MIDGHTVTVHDCDEHEECTVIVGFQDSREIWRSHMHSAIHAEHRLNLDHPVATDHRSGRERKIGWSPVCEDCAEHGGWHGLTAETIEHLHAEASKRGLHPKTRP